MINHWMQRIPFLGFLPWFFRYQTYFFVLTNQIIKIHFPSKCASILGSFRKNRATPQFSSISRWDFHVHERNHPFGVLGVPPWLWKAPNPMAPIFQGIVSPQVKAKVAGWGGLGVSMFDVPHEDTSTSEDSHFTRETSRKSWWSEIPSMILWGVFSPSFFSPNSS